MVVKPFSIKIACLLCKSLLQGRFKGKAAKAIAIGPPMSRGSILLFLTFFLVILSENNLIVYIF